MLRNKTALITGTNRGLGRSLLKEFIRNGANVIAHARKDCEVCADNGDSLLFSEWCVKIAEKYGVSVRPLFFDMTDYDSMESSVARIMDEGTRIDILVNNAGVGKWGYFQLMPMDVVRATMEINLFAPMTLTQLLLRYMISNGGGSIINIASVYGVDPVTGNCAYGVSKSGLIAFTKSLAAECGQFKVRCNAVAPGLMETEMSHGWEKAKDSFRNASALTRLCTVDDVAKTVAFLASDMASYINGQTIVLDGGKK